MSEEYLQKYSKMLRSNELPNIKKLRDKDVADYFLQNNHAFSFNYEIIMSYDICGNCEAHGMLLAIEKGLSNSIESAPTLNRLERKFTMNNKNFLSCPED